MAEARICPNCGEPGDPGYHWLEQPGVFSGYVCFGTDSGTDPEDPGDPEGGRQITNRPITDE